MKSGFLAANCGSWGSLLKALHFLRRMDQHFHVDLPRAVLQNLRRAGLGTSLSVLLDDEQVELEGFLHLSLSKGPEEENTVWLVLSDDTGYVIDRQKQRCFQFSKSIPSPD